MLIVLNCLFNFLYQTLIFHLYCKSQFTGGDIYIYRLKTLHLKNKCPTHQFFLFKQNVPLFTLHDWTWKSTTVVWMWIVSLKRSTDTMKWYAELCTLMTCPSRPAVSRSRVTVAGHGSPLRTNSSTLRRVGRSPEPSTSTYNTPHTHSNAISRVRRSTLTAAASHSSVFASYA